MEEEWESKLKDLDRRLAEITEAVKSELTDSPESDEIVEQRIDQFLENGQFEEAMSELVEYLTVILAGKVSTKRVAEKAGSKYVDASFLRVLTQVSSQVDQSTKDAHSELQRKLDSVKADVEALRAQMTGELDDMQRILNEASKELEEFEKTAEYGVENTKKAEPKKQSKVAWVKYQKKKEVVKDQTITLPISRFSLYQYYKEHPEELNK